MAEVHNLPGAKAPEIEPAAAAVSVQGWDRELRSADAVCPPVIVNPAASSAALADWARAQFDQVGHLLTHLSCAGEAEGVNTERSIAAICHFHDQGVVVMHALVDRVDAEARLARHPTQGEREGARDDR